MGYISELRMELGSRPLIVAGSGVIVVNDKNEILLGKRTDNGYWDYPAGSMEIGESFEECARREVLEETGLYCDDLEFLMNLSGKESFYEYPNGDKVYLTAMIYICRDYGHWNLRGSIEYSKDEQNSSSDEHSDLLLYDEYSHTVWITWGENW